MRVKRSTRVVALAVGVTLVTGGAAVAAGWPEDQPVTGANAGEARAAAVAYLGSGRAGSVELDGEHGGTYDVEVHGASGTVTDVWLDASFRGVAATIDREG